MRSRIAILCCAVLTISIPASVLAWGSLTHTYFATQLGYRPGYLNYQEVYGSTLPDMFNLMYGSPHRDYLWDQTHVEFMKYVNQCNALATKASAYGFASHNDVWGADFTAHHSAVTNPGEGYVPAKVEMLAPSLEALLIEIFTTAGVPGAAVLAAQLAPMLADTFVEVGVDILIKRNEDPSAGRRLAVASQMRDYRVPSILTEAYAADFAEHSGMSLEEATTMIRDAEREFRDLMKLYGGVFAMSEGEAIALLTQRGVALARNILGPEVGDEAVQSLEVLAVFFRDVVIPTLELDYAAEIAATLAYLEDEMRSHGFPVQLPPTTRPFDGMPDLPVTGTDGSPLVRNHPNPFSDETVVRYSLPARGFVDLSVYDPSGRLVTTLVSTEMPGGLHESRWDATDLSGSRVGPGLYFLRLRAGGSAATSKIILLK